MVSVTTPPTCAVRAARPTDGNAMAALAVQLGYQCTEAEVRKRLGDMKDPAQYGIFVAELLDGQVAGWVAVYVFRAIELDTFAEISGLVVDETLRSRGVGKMLVGAAEEWARDLGCTAVSVHSNVIRDRAHRFYTSNGYELLKTQKMFCKNL